MRLQVKMTGFNDLKRALEKKGDKAKDVLEDVVLAGAEVIRDEMSQRAPRRTGELAEKIITETLEKTNTKAEAGIGPDESVAWRARFLEFGTKNMEAEPFVFPAFEAKKDEAEREMANRLRRELIK